MRAVVTTGKRTVELVERPEPAVGPGQALVRVEAVGICGSDIHIYTGEHPYLHYPQIQGHEFCGTVLTFGEGYQGPVRVGERVAVEPLISCGTCYPCRQHRPNCCASLAVLGVQAPGALAEQIVVNATSLYPVGDLEVELGALVEPISIGVQGVTRGDVTAEDRAVIFGAGPIGQAVLLAAQDRGAQTLVVDMLPSRLQLAQALGADRVVNASSEIVEEAVRAWTNGEGPSIIFEATGAPSVIRQAVELVASAGRVVIIGVSTQEVSLPAVEFTRKELTVLGSRNSTGVFAQAVDLVRRKRERARLLITHRFPLEKTHQALEFALTHPTEAEKVVIVL
jgi:L-gulonate 5-dehydrogenase